MISVGLASTALIQLSGAAQVVTLLGAGALLAVTGLAGCTRPAESRRCGELIGGRARAMLKAEGCAGRAPPGLKPRFGQPMVRGALKSGLVHAMAR